MMPTRARALLMLLLLFVDSRAFAKSCEMPSSTPLSSSGSARISRGKDNQALHRSDASGTERFSKEVRESLNNSLAPEEEEDSWTSNMHKMLKDAALIMSGEVKRRKSAKIPGLISITRGSDLEAPTEKRSDISRLHKKFWSEVNRMRNVSEAYPDVQAEKAKERIVRKTVVNVLNLIAAKKYEEEKKQLLEASAPKPMITDGSKSLGFKGNERFKPVQTDAGGKPKKTKKRKPEDEMIKLLGEFLRDKAKVQALTKQKKDPNNPFLVIRRVTNRYARQVEREQLKEFIKAEEEKKSQKNKPKARSGTEAVQGVRPRAAERPSSMRLRGGGEETSDLQAYLPWSYPSISSWIFAMIKLLSVQLFRSLGFAGKGTHSASAAPQKGLPQHVHDMMNSVSMDSRKLKELKGRRVLVVTNNAVFKESDIQKVFFQGETHLQMIEGVGPVLMHLAASTDLFLVTQFPHSGHDTLTRYMENHTVVNETYPHGSWKDDECEGVVVEALREAGICDAGLNSTHILFCETVEGRGYLGRVLGEYSAENKLALMVDDNPESVGWFQNVCRNTTTIAISTSENQGNFATVSLMCVGAMID
ncbi:hypothetical protein GUITHDRAFT_103203 [Guillardia theta CCMP2712]|uniref:Uncharacterized protein n=1 Tax=Guillardia theta (strain CCMP2712) TaxID=905079 RepID=L1JS83_GUITC|nr:hypothetical protein GUITHDRAFT_103203 [Guillardia theta CCMP2712]EKX51287.1 hypothetical protein GUITHDRAFT_103203 [Guillardia theta CCMP2712]|eukprot:XP_005838267.1 hypothetical protein GUITHDRAFT_103203 [Guillardia theta CCMP2712]